MRVRNAFLFAVAVFSLPAFFAQVAVPSGAPAVHDIRPGPGVTATKMLSAYAPGLANTPGDTTVYVLEGQEPGATVFVAGGTHGNEIAGIMAAIVLVEHARVQQGPPDRRAAREQLGHHRRGPRAPGPAVHHADDGQRRAAVSLRLPPHEGSISRARPTRRSTAIPTRRPTRPCRAPRRAT